MKFVSYIRVSTKQQGISGLGLEAQQAAIAAYLNGGERLAEYHDVESGKHDGPTRAARCTEARQDDGRHAHHRQTGQAQPQRGLHRRIDDSGVEFIACDMPQANKFTVHIMAAVASRSVRQPAHARRPL